MKNRVLEFPFEEFLPVHFFQGIALEQLKDTERISAIIVLCKTPERQCGGIAFQVHVVKDAQKFFLMLQHLGCNGEKAVIVDFRRGTPAHVVVFGEAGTPQFPSPCNDLGLIVSKLPAECGKGFLNAVIGHISVKIQQQELVIVEPVIVFRTFHFLLVKFVQS